jgi:hypothetical protein
MTWSYKTPGQYGCAARDSNPNPRIKSPLLRNSIHPVYQHVCVIMLARYPQFVKAECRLLTADAAWYRDIRANMEQTRKPYGLDHYGRIVTATV